MRIAVLGTGSIGFRHLRVISSIDGIEPIAVPIRKSRLAELEANGLVTAPDIHSAACKGAGAAIIATDTARHVEDVIAAMDAGLDVLAEKPLAVDSAEAHPVRQRAVQSERKVYVGCVLRFSESLNTFRANLPKIGRLHSVRIECLSYLPDWRPSRAYQESYSARADEGGVLRDLIHEIDYAGWLFGWPIALQARVRNLGRLGIRSEEVAELMWETSFGCFVSLSLDYLSRPGRRRMRAAGELGALEWDGIEGTVTMALAGAPPWVMTSTQASDEMFLEQTRAFVDALRGTSDPRLATANEGVKALAVCDTARRASESRYEERVEYP